MYECKVKYKIPLSPILRINLLNENNRMNNKN